MSTTKHKPEPIWHNAIAQIVAVDEAPGDSDMAPDCAIMAEALEGSSATLLLLVAGPHGLVAPCAWPLAAADDMVRGSAK